MESGCFGKFGRVTNLKDQINYFELRHEHHPTRHELISVVQTTKVSNFRNEPLFEGIVVDQKMAEVPRLVKTPDNRYQIVVETKPVTIYARYSIIGNGLIILENSMMRAEAYRVMSQAMNRTNDFIEFCGFDTQKIFDDLDGFWMTSIAGREGNWKSGTQRGDDLEDDDAIGRILKRANKRAVGFYTNYFSGDRLKVSVTASGSAAVWGSVSREDFYGYAIDELQSYMTNTSA